jgi:hypothetical protein
MELSPSHLGDLLDTSRAEVVLIQDVWIGYHHASPIAARYALRRGRGGGLSGEGVLSTALTKRPKLVPVAMKSATASAFLNALASADLVPGAYAPVRDHTDDYPRIEIVVQVPADNIGDRSGILLLYTESQGDLHVPWAAFVGGAAYVVQDDTIGRALRALDRTLAKPELRRMADV